MELNDTVTTNYFVVTKDVNNILTVTITSDTVTYIRVCGNDIEPESMRVFRNMELDKNNLAIPNATNTTDTDIWVNGYRYSSSGLAAEAGTSVSNKILIQKGDTIKISGVTLREGKDRVYIDLTTLNGSSGQAIGYFNNGASSGGVTVIEYKGYSDGVYTFYIPSTYAGEINYFRFAMPTPTNFSEIKVIREDDMDNGDNSELTQGEITSEVTWEKDKRLSSTSGSYSDLTGSYASSDIPCKNGDIIRLYNVSKGTNYNYVAAFGSSYFSFIDIAYDGNVYSNTYMTATRVDGVTTITILHDSVECIRVCSNGGIDPSTVRISRNKELNKNYFDVNGEGYVAWNGSKMYTNYIHYKCAEVGSKLSPIYHIKGGTPYKFRIIYPDKSTTTDLVYATNANGQANVTAAYDSEVKLLQHDFSDGYGEGYLIQFEFRTDCASDLIIQIDENIVG